MTSLWIALPAVPLIVAAVSDARSREVPDVCWAVFLALGSVMTVVNVADGIGPVPTVAYLVGSALLALYMLSPGLTGASGMATVVASLVCLIAVPVLYECDRWIVASASVPVMFLVYLAMYRARILAGGADTKCLMTLAMVFPVYPVSASPLMIWVPAYPEAFVLNPSVSVMLLALILSMAWMPAVLLRNLRGRRFSMDMFHVYRMDIGDAGAAHVWLVEAVSDGTIVRTRGCELEDRETILDGLVAAGRSDVLVTPMIPFVVPMAVAYPVIMLAGSPFLSLLTLRC